MFSRTCSDSKYRASSRHPTLRVIRSQIVAKHCQVSLLDLPAHVPLGRHDMGTHGWSIIRGTGSFAPADRCYESAVERRSNDLCKHNTLIRLLRLDAKLFHTRM